jgi:hypothetical protein
VWFLSAAAAGFALSYLMAALLLVGTIRLGKSAGAGWSTFN